MKYVWRITEKVFMEHEFYLPKGDLPKKIWLNQFSKGLSTHGADLDVSDETIVATKADAEYYGKLMDYLISTQEYENLLVTVKNEMITSSSTVLADIPVFKAMAIHVAVLPGIFDRTRALVSLLKKHNDLTPGMIQDMGLEGNKIIHDFSKIVVNAKVTIRNSQPYLSWNHQGTDAVDIRCDYGDALGMVNVERITATHFIDPRLPAADISEIYKYKFRYVVNDQQVGEWSPIFEIVVKGIRTSD